MNEDIDCDGSGTLDVCSTKVPHKHCKCGEPLIPDDSGFSIVIVTPIYDEDGIETDEATEEAICDWCFDELCGISIHAKDGYIRETRTGLGSLPPVGLWAAADEN